MRCDAPIKKHSSAAKPESAAATAPSSAAAKAINTEDAPCAATKSNVTTTPVQPTVVVDDGDQDTPEQPSPKKPRTNTITKFLTNPIKKVCDAVVATFGSPTPYDTASSLLAPMDQKPAAESSFTPSPSGSLLSPSFLVKKGDGEAEAGLAGTAECEVTTKPEIAPQNSEEELFTPGQALKHYPIAESPNMSWTDLQSQMRREGWGYKKGNRLVAWFWVHPSAAKLKKADMLRLCTEGVHYFATERDLKKYATEHLGWAGEVIESSPVSDMSMTARVKKRNQTTNAFKLLSSPPKRSRASTEGGNEKLGDTSPPSKKSRSSPRNEEIKAAKSSSPGSNSADSASVTSQSSSESRAPPDKEATVREKLVCCEMVLHPSFNKNELSKSSSASVVLSMEEDINEFMMKSVTTGMTVDGMTSPSPGFMYLCGGPGTGKVSLFAVILRILFYMQS